MFTGIIEDLGKVDSLRRFRDRMALTITTRFIGELKAGDSVSVNGVCLTAAEKTRASFTSDVMQETFRRSALQYLRVGDFVNLERALPAAGRFDGHIVLGHVDCKSMIIGIQNNGSARSIEVKLPDEYRKYMTDKCSVAVDGVSLTANYSGGSSFSVAIIPHTALNTNLFHKKAGDWVNLEFDVLAKYLEGLLKDNKIGSLLPMKDMRIDEEFLKKAGFLN